MFVGFRTNSVCLLIQQIKTVLSKLDLLAMSGAPIVRAELGNI